MLKLHYITSNNVKKNKIALTACIKQKLFKLNF